MFDSSYPFRFIQNVKPRNDEFFLVKRLYTFKGKGGLKYLVDVEEYDHNVYAVKFYASAHTYREDRFAIETNLMDMLSIVGTCVEIMITISQEVATASFVAIGAASEEEQEANTQRFRIYDLLFRNIFGPANYAHYRNNERSTVFAIHRSAFAGEGEVFEAIKQMFLKYFDIQMDM